MFLPITEEQMVTEYYLKNLSRSQINAFRKYAKIGICTIHVVVEWVKNPEEVLAGLEGPKTK